MRGSAIRLSLLIGAAAALTLPLGASAQTKPALDLSGAWQSQARWRYDPPATGAKGVQDDPQHPHIARGQDAAGRDVGANAWVADVSNPILKPWVVEKLKAINASNLAGNDPPKAEASCVPGGVPMQDTFAESTYFLQQPDEITVLYQRGQWARHIYLNREHSKTVAPSWFGESVGHFDGDTLVVDTIGQNDKSWTDIYGTPHTDQIHTVERFQLIDNGRMLKIDFTVEDPGAFNMPWSGGVRYRRGNQPQMEEVVCAENNYDFIKKKSFPLPIAEKRDF